MKRTIIYLVLSVPLAWMSGCGTINNTMVGTEPAPPHKYTPPLEVYGGVRSDLRNIAEGISPPYPSGVGENVSRLAATALMLADVPFSVIGDTLTLGKTIPASIKRSQVQAESHPD